MTAKRAAKRATQSPPEETSVPALVLALHPHGYVCRACRHTTDFADGLFRCDLCETIGALRPAERGERAALDRAEEKLREKCPVRTPADPVDRLDDLGRARTLRRLRRERKFSEEDIRDLWDPARDNAELEAMQALDGGYGEEGGEDDEDDRPPPDLDAVRASDVQPDPTPRLKTHLSGLDALLDQKGSRGVKIGKVVLVSGDPGVGKSTWLQQALAEIADRHKKEIALYASPEEPSEDVVDNLRRFGIKPPNNMLIAGNETEHGSNIDALCKFIEDKRPVAVVADSLQEFETQKMFVAGVAGERAQVIYVARALVDACEAAGTVCFLVGHMTKDNKAAGPNLIVHKVHATARLEHGRFEVHDKTGRIAWKRLDEPPTDGTVSFIRAYTQKNRGGRRGDVYLQMTDGGLVDVEKDDAVASQASSPETPHRGRRSAKPTVEDRRHRAPAVDAPRARGDGGSKRKSQRTSKPSRRR